MVGSQSVNLLVSWCLSVRQLEDRSFSQSLVSQLSSLSSFSHAVRQ